MNAITELVFIETGGSAGGLTADRRYIQEILADHVVPYAGFIGENFFTPMQDNARPHGVASVRYSTCRKLQ